jgi:hypothetical protein
LDLTEILLKPFTDEYTVSFQTLFLPPVQAALVIRGLGIRGFDYSRVRKWGKTANIKGNFINLSLK